MPRASSASLQRTFGLISVHFGIFWRELKGTERPTAAAEPHGDVGDVAK